MKPIISVLVPCYNVEKYLNQCIDSIINQTFTDIEIICLNDGSTDNTLNILKEYEAKDNRIIIVDKPNSGYGATMNIGLDKARGKYIAIVESDDYIEKEMFEVLHNEAESKNLDVARCLYIKRNEITGIDEVVDDHNWGAYELDKVFTPIKQKSIFFIAPSIWAMIYNREFLERNNIRFLETPGASYQDTSFNFKVLAMVEKMEVVSKVLHNYRINCNSSVNSAGKLFCVCDEDAEIHKYAKEHGVYEELKEELGRRMFSSYKWNYGRLKTYKLRYTFAKKVATEIKQALKDGEITRKYFSKSKISRLRLLIHCPWLFSFRKRF